MRDEITKAKKIISIEINPNSYHYLCENIKLNKCDNITPVLGDCRLETPKFRADRILMGYVKTTHHYLKVAIDSLNKGGIIHYHETVPEKLIETRPISRIRQSAGDREVELLEINRIKNLGMTSITELKNQDINLRLGNHYYKFILNGLNNNNILAIGAYNGGIGSISRWKKGLEYRDIDEFVEKIPYTETRVYVKKVFRTYWNYARLYL